MSDERCTNCGNELVCIRPDNHFSGEEYDCPVCVRSARITELEKELYYCRAAAEAEAEGLDKFKKRAEELEAEVEQLRLRPEVPKGWCVVPTEPTERMLNRGIDLSPMYRVINADGIKGKVRRQSISDKDCRVIYLGMLAAAPQSEDEEQER